MGNPKIYACLISAEEADKGTTLGLNYIMEHESDLIEFDIELGKLIVPGFTKGIDHVMYQGKAYIIWKDYADIENDRFIMLCRESTAGSDVISS